MQFSSVSYGHSDKGNLRTSGAHHESACLHLSARNAERGLIRQVSCDEEAVKLMNDSKYGLTASIWTCDEGAFESLVDKIETGTVFQNRCDYLDPALAWTAVKHSGRGVSLSKYGKNAHQSQ